MSLPSSPLSPPTGSPTFPSAGERADRLLAVARLGDPKEASRLLCQWVHRAGIDSLEAFLSDPARFGPETQLRDWLMALLASPLSPGSAPALPETVPAAVAPIDSPVPPSVGIENIETETETETEIEDKDEGEDEMKDQPLPEPRVAGASPLPEDLPLSESPSPVRDLTSIAAIDPWLAQTAPAPGPAAPEPVASEPATSQPATPAAPPAPQAATEKAPAEAPGAEESPLAASTPFFSFEFPSPPEPLASMPPGPAGLDAGAACSAALEPSDSAVAAEAASADTAATGAAATDPAADDTQACGTAASESAERPGRFPALSIPSPLAWGRRSLGRVRAVMRDCYEETIAGFAHDDEFQREQKQDATSGVPADPGAVPHPDADLAPAAASIAAGRVPPGQVMPDSREPFDSFSGLEPAPPGGIAFSRRSSAAAPPAVSSPPVASAATPASPAPATCPAGSRAPAPGPSGLEDLRSWLPDPDEDRDDAFPRAS